LSSFAGDFAQHFRTIRSVVLLVVLLKRAANCRIMNHLRSVGCAGRVLLDGHLLGLGEDLSRDEI
jgi:hypothetical protein